MEINISDLEWSLPIHWEKVEEYVNKKQKAGVHIPDEPGVYRVWNPECSEVLYIGMASNLRHRVKQCLARGTAPHTVSKKRLPELDITPNQYRKFHIQWAQTIIPAAMEEALLFEHVISIIIKEQQADCLLPKFHAQSKSSRFNKKHAEDWKNLCKT